METVAVTQEKKAKKRVETESELDRDFFKNLRESLEDIKHGRIRRVA